MNKSKILTLATTAAVIATTAGTFALWDTFSNSAEATINIQDGKTVTVNEGTFGAMTPVVGQSDITYTGNADFTIEGYQHVGSLTPKIELYEGTTKLTDTNVIEAIIENPDEAITNKVVYNTKVIVKNNSLANKNIKVKVTVEATAIK